MITAMRDGAVGVDLLGGVGEAGTTMGSSGLSRLFLFQGDRYCRVRRQAHLLPFDTRDQSQVYEMMMIFVTSFAAVGLREAHAAAALGMVEPEL